MLEILHTIRGKSCVAAALSLCNASQDASLVTLIPLKEISLWYSDENQQYMKMTKDAILEGSSQQAKKDFITRKNGQGPKHLKFFLLVFSKDEAQAQEGQGQAQPMKNKAKH